MVHYPSAILNSGPLKHVWSFRFEAKHKNFKNYCRNITSRKNLPFTLSIKAGLQFANSIFKKEYNSMIELRINALEVNKTKIDRIFSIINRNDYNELSISNNIEYRGIMYKSGFFLTILQSELKLFEIVNIIVINNRNIKIFCNNISLISYNEHYSSYEVGLKNQELEIFNIEEFTGPPIHIYTTAEGTKLIRNKLF